VLGPILTAHDFSFDMRGEDHAGRHSNTHARDTSASRGILLAAKKFIAFIAIRNAAARKNFVQTGNARDRRVRTICLEIRATTPTATNAA
jgi:hypothetical protein